MTFRRPRPFGYESLMPNLVKDILLVASPYDRFILEEDGRFADRLLSQYAEMDLSAPPRFYHVATARQALERLEKDPYDLVLTTPHCTDLRPMQLAARVARDYPAARVAMLTYDRSQAMVFSQYPRTEGLDQVFVWTGDPKLLVTLVKSVEDLRNVDHDTKEGLVRVIIVVEDSPSFYSSYLPLIYSEVLDQVETLLAERLHERDRRHRRRARPKILLARNYEEAVDLFGKYHEYTLGVITDRRFPRDGRQDETAGLDFIRLVRERQPDIPVLLQSSDAVHADVARKLNIHFADKKSPELLQQVRQFIRKYFGFGPFIFCLPTGEEVGKAEDLTEMLEAIRNVPPEALRFHAERNHISNWLMARSEFALALEMRPRRVTDFGTTEEMRDYVVEVLTSFLEYRQRGEITEFVRGSSGSGRDFTRLGRGSMGGKARGVAFVSHLLAGHEIHEKYPDVRVRVPRTFVLCTENFERFVEKNGLREQALETSSDEEIARLFVSHPLSPELEGDLVDILEQVSYPLAVRSSSLNEDSEFQPLAGLYKTYMLPNCAASPQRRLDQLTKTIRLIFASTFFAAARRTLAASALRVEEERMAVILQRLVGHRHGDTFYPDFSGVAQSYNYYPLGYMRPEDGVATVALGLGESIVGGRRALRFSPRHPEILPQMPTPRRALRNSQQDFYAVDLSDPDLEPTIDDHTGLVLLDLRAAEKDGTLAALGATYSPENDTVYDSIYRSGVRLVNFAGVLKHGQFPLAPLLQDLLRLGEEGMGTPVEMEFAVSLARQGRPAEMAVLQMRPLVARGREVEVDLAGSGALGKLLLAGPALGNGVTRGIRDVIYIHPRRMDLLHSRQTAAELRRLNHLLETEQRPYLLLGPGRWGSADSSLGVPVDWADVAGVAVIAELVLSNRSIDPSQGTHFFHNLTSLNIGYFSLTLGDDQQTIGLDYLEALPAETETTQLRHVRLPVPLEVYIDGRVGQGLALLPPHSKAAG